MVGGEGRTEWYIGNNEIYFISLRYAIKQEGDERGGIGEPGGKTHCDGSADNPEAVGGENRDYKKEIVCDEFEE